jgi:hypothetical protein
VGLDQRHLSQNFLWTPAPKGINIAESRAVPPTPSAAPGIPFECGLAMISSNYPRSAARLLSLLMAILVFAASASAEWKESVLYSFQGGSSDGSIPAGGVIFDKAGNLYGADTSGGSGGCPDQGCGMVFQLSPPTQKGGAWTETSIYAFRGVTNGGTDGFTPAGGLIIDGKENLYGTTAYGGDGSCILLGTKAGCGIVYELSPPAEKGGQWTYKILYNFQGGHDGYFPSGNLVIDKAGNLYGATQFGGGKGTTCNVIYGGQCGTVFELSPPPTKRGKWKEKVLHAFAGDSDGANPNGGLVLDSEGAIYGTTFAGGYNCPHHSGQGCGTVFKLDPPAGKDGAWTEKQLLVFKNGADGAQPIAGVILDAGGSIYGAAEGGTNGCGLVFKLAANGGGRWKDTVLYSFGGSEYYYGPAVSQIDASGNLYGTTNAGGGESLQGSVFRLKPPRKGGDWTLFTIHGFSAIPYGEIPTSVLTFGKAGNLYGTTQGGGTGSGCGFTGCGTVFEIKP